MNFQFNFDLSIFISIRLPIKVNIEKYFHIKHKT